MTRSLAALVLLAEARFFAVVRAYAESELQAVCRDEPDGVYCERLPRQLYAFAVNQRPVACGASMWGVFPELWKLDEQVAELRRALETEFGPGSVAVDDVVGRASECQRPWPARIASP